MYVIKKENGDFKSLFVKELNSKQIKAISSKLSKKILDLLSKGENYPLKIAKILKIHEQKIYYHIKKLYEAKIIKKIRQDYSNGVLVNYYSLVSPSFFLKFDEFKEVSKINLLDDKKLGIFEDFIENGELNALIVMGSPNPHGPKNVRARDGNLSIDFALFLGSFLNRVSKLNVKLDIDVRSEDLKNNLILIGGSRVNRVTNQINDKLPIFFDEVNNFSLKSKLTGKIYSEDNYGLIVKIKNPFFSAKKILVIGGKRAMGTKASIVTFLKNFNELNKGNLKNNKILARVVEGLDLNSDGQIDKIKFKE